MVAQRNQSSRERYASACKLGYLCWSLCNGVPIWLEAAGGPGGPVYHPLMGTGSDGDWGRAKVVEDLVAIDKALNTLVYWARVALESSHKGDADSDTFARVFDLRKTDDSWAEQFYPRLTPIEVLAPSVYSPLKSVYDAVFRLDMLPHSPWIGDSSLDEAVEQGTQDAENHMNEAKAALRSWLALPSGTS